MVCQDKIRLCRKLTGADLEPGKAERMRDFNLQGKKKSIGGRGNCWCLHFLPAVSVVSGGGQFWWVGRTPGRAPGWKLGTRWPPSYSRAASSALRDTPLSRAKWKQNLPPSNPAGCLLEFQWQGGWRSAGFKPQGYHPSVLTEGVQRHGLPRQPFRGGLVLFQLPGGHSHSHLHPPEHSAVK